MVDVTLATISYRPDLERCALACAGVARCAGPGIRHAVVVPRADLAAFANRLGGAGPTLLAQEDFLPGWLFRLPWSEKWRITPWGFPVRGWIRQQVVKLALAASSLDHAVMFLDSDTVPVRPFDSGLAVAPDGRVRWRRYPGRGDTPMHHRWHRGATRLLGLPVRDYLGAGFISPLSVWSPVVVRLLLERLAARGRCDWRTGLLHSWTLSEYTLYGAFAQEVLGMGGDLLIADDSRPVHEYWEHDHLDLARLDAFLGQIADENRFILVQSKADYDHAAYAERIRRMWA
jgi:hypothetical protein